MGAWILLVLSVALGFAVARVAWPAPRLWSAADPLRLAMAPAVGMGVASCLYFAMRIVLHQPPAIVVTSIVAILGAVGVLAWHRAETALPDPVHPSGAMPRWLSIILWSVSAMALVTFLLLHAAAPHGEWDSWSIWTLRARFLFRAQEFLSPFSSAIEWTHPDYPLLIPGAIALLWHAGGSESTAVAGATGLLFAFSCVAVPYFAVRHLRGVFLATLCAISILSATSIIRVGASLYADVPLAAFIVISGALLVYGLEVETAGSGPFLLAGLAAGLAAWTKNEGLLFCVSLGAAYLLSVSGVAEFRRRVRKPAPLLGGMAAVLLLVGHFKFRMAPENDLVSASKLGAFGARIIDFERYWTASWAFLGDALTFGNALIPPVIVLSAWLAVVRFRTPFPGAAWLPLIAVLVQLIGYYVIFVATSNNLDWQLSTSLSRLFLQVWPLAATGVFLISRDILNTPAQPPRPVPASK